jgi:predicted metal-binding membrane protein
MMTSGSLGRADVPAAGVRAVPEFFRHRDCLWLAIGLSAVVALCWAWVVAMARDMYGPMTGASAWMMTNQWDLPHMTLLFVMWVAMMAGMMLPSVAPTVWRVAAGRPARAALAFTGGYIAVWTGFSLLATIVQRLLDHAQILSPMMELRDARWSAAILVIAGLYQFTPLKRICLQSCRCAQGIPAGGGFLPGVRNGLNCLGCCWALMLLLFAGGVMNLWWNLGLTLLVLLEKIAPPGRQGSRILGLGLAGAGGGFGCAALPGDPRRLAPKIAPFATPLL